MTIRYKYNVIPFYSILFYSILYPYPIQESQFGLKNRKRKMFIFIKIQENIYVILYNIQKGKCIYIFI